MLFDELLSAVGIGLLIGWVIAAVCVAITHSLRTRRRKASTLTSVSLGYTATWVPAEGQVDGEPYDFEQQDIRADHVYLDVERMLNEAKPRMNAPCADTDACQRVLRAVNARVHPRVQVSPEASVSSSSWAQLPGAK